MLIFVRANAAETARNKANRQYVGRDSCHQVWGQVANKQKHWWKNRHPMHRWKIVDKFEKYQALKEHDLIWNLISFNGGSKRRDQSRRHFHAFDLVKGSRNSKSEQNTRSSVSANISGEESGMDLHPMNWVMF